LSYRRLREPLTYVKRTEQGSAHGAFEPMRA
jgi:hypothetical protein